MDNLALLETIDDQLADVTETVNERWSSHLARARAEVLFVLGRLVEET
jgi:hypothetical protein